MNQRKIISAVIIIVVITIVLVCSFLVFNSSAEQENVKSEEYPLCGIVTSVEKKARNDYEVTFTCLNGNSFAFKTANGDWFKGDVVACIMNDNGTEEIEDDEIKSYRYCGYSEGGFQNVSYYISE